MSDVLLIRADATAAMGTGHVMRCMALAQAWQARGGSVHFVLAAVPGGLEARLRSEDIAVTQLAAAPGSTADARQTVALARKLEAAWVAVDGYQFDAAYQRVLKENGARLLFVDDYGHADWYAADFVLNQNSYADAATYIHRAAGTQLLLGTRYALLRREFWPWREWQRDPARATNRVLVTFGGSDQPNVTRTIIRALRQIEQPHLHVKAVVGVANPHRESLRAAASGMDCRVELLSAVDNMPELMAWADVAVSAAGSTCWELAFMGLPMVVVTLAENQQPIAADLAARGMAVSLGWHDQVHEQSVAEAITSLLARSAARQQISEQGRALVDGFGAARVVEALQQV